MGTLGALPALSVQRPEDMLEQYGRALALRNLGLQSQAEGLQIQQQQMALSDQQALTKAMRNWDGQDLGDLYKGMINAGASGQAVLNFKSKMLDQQKTYSDIALNDAKAGTERAQTLQKNADMLAGHFDAIKGVPDDQLPDAILKEVNTAVYGGYLDSQSAAGIKSMVEQSKSDPSTLRDKLDLLEKGLTIHSQQIEQALKQAQTGEATGKLDPNSPLYSPTSAYLNKRAAAGDPEAKAILAQQAQQAGAVAGSEAQAKLPYEIQARQAAAEAAVRAQAAQYAGNSALARVPPHLVAPATADATKLAQDYAAAKSAADNMSAFINLAKSGNKAASVNVPLQGALEITTAQGVHRINRTEVEQYGSAGSLFDKISGKIQGTLTGKNIPNDVLQDMAQLQSVISGNAQAKYLNGLKAVNQNYGSNFTPVQMDTGGAGAGNGYTRIKASDGSLHDIPTQNLAAARQRDPQLQVIQ